MQDNPNPSSGPIGPDTPDPLDWIGPQLAELARRGLRRRRGIRQGRQAPLVCVEGRELIHFGSNDYLGLAADPRVLAAAGEAIRAEGWGTGASPLIFGQSTAHQQLEQRLAEFEGTEAALLFGSGFAANAGTIAALVGPGDAVYTDRKNHASLLDGCRLSRADVRPYPHGDWERLEDLLGRGQYRRRLIVTDSLFSMDGDLAPLSQLADVAQRHGAMLMIDEAHATGVFGPHGRGAAEHLGVDGRIAIRVGTLSKALGSIGGFVAGRRDLIDWLLNTARPYVFSTATPAAAAAAAQAALQIVRDEPARREVLLSQAHHLRERLRAGGWNVGHSASQIIPIVVGEADQAVRLAEQLRQRGMLVPAIRPPTVPQGESCLRISLTAGHTPQMIDRLLHALSDSAAQRLTKGWEAPEGT